MTIIIKALEISKSFIFLNKGYLIFCLTHGEFGKIFQSSDI